MNQEPDHRLLRRALDGCTDELPALVRRFSPIIQARTVRVLGRLHHLDQRRTRQEVEEFVQHVFLSLFDDDAAALRSWRPEGGLSLDNWIGLIAERQVLSLVRTRKRNPWTEDPVPAEDLDGVVQSPGPEAQAVGRDLQEQLLDRIQERLSPLGWQLFGLLYIQELSVNEAAVHAGMSHEAIYAWRSRLRRLAREMYQELLSETKITPRIPLREAGNS